jgi:glycerophosphoryl diester phosphodiesterase
MSLVAFHTARGPSALFVAMSCLVSAVACAPGGVLDLEQRRRQVQVGPRPYYLVEKMSPGPLKERLERCGEDPFRPTKFSIGHRGGAALQFPEHTLESHVAGARMGAGILECDVTFTRDGVLVCRHDQCDLHTTTNILVTPLADRCSVPFSPAEFDASGNLIRAASALCCTSDLDVGEFKTLEGKMEGSNPNARTAQEYLDGTPAWRTELHATGGTLLTHAESIALIARLGAEFAPELKGPNRAAKLQLEAVFGTRAAFAQAMIDDYARAGIAPNAVWPQSFDEADVLYWVRNEPAFGRRAVLLDDAISPADVPTAEELQRHADQGIRVVAPPMWMLVSVDASGRIVPSPYAKDAKAAGLDLLTWTVERSGRIAEDVLPTRGSATPSFYYQSTLDVLEHDGDLMKMLDVLARDVGVLGVFSDWSGTVTYYASCMGLD